MDGRNERRGRDVALDPGATDEGERIDRGLAPALHDQARGAEPMTLDQIPQGRTWLGQEQPRPTARTGLSDASRLEHDRPLPGGRQRMGGGAADEPAAHDYDVGRLLATVRLELRTPGFGKLLDPG